MDLRHVHLHGHDVGYRMAGEGPAIVLIHGMAGSSLTWREVMPLLAQQLHRDRTGSPGSRGIGQARWATTRWAPTRAGCAT